MELSPFEKRYAAEARRALESLAGRQLSGAEIGRLETMCKVSTEAAALVVANPVKSVRAPTNMLKFLDFMEKRRPIITGHGTLFETHENHHSVIADLVSFLMSERKVVKKKMLNLIKAGKHPEDPEVKALDQEQKIYKLLANSFYGAFAERGFHFYNAAMGPAVTYTGQLIIAATLYGFEALLTGNAWLKDEAELVRFVESCLTVAAGEDPTEAWGQCKPDPEGPAWVPGPEDTARALRKVCAPGWDCAAAVARAVARVGSRHWAVALRGDPHRFFVMTGIFERITTAVSGPAIKEAGAFHAPAGAGPEVQEALDATKRSLDEIAAAMIKWVATHQMPGDLPRRVQEMARDTVLLVDTDSTFLNLRPWMDFVGGHFDLAGAPPEDRLTVMNCMIYMLAKFSDWQMQFLTRNLNVPEDKRSMINFKSEFVMKRVILTGGKKNYAGLLTFQEGAAIIDKKLKIPGKIEIKGLSIKKVNTPKETGEYFKQAIEARLLRPDVPARPDMVRDLVTFEARLRGSIEKGETRFATPGSVKRMSEYASPFSLPAVRARIAWNCCYHADPINEGDRINMFRIKIGTDLAGLVKGIGLDPMIPIETQVKVPEGSDIYDVEVAPGLSLGGLQNLIYEFFTDGDEALRSNGFNWMAFPKTIHAIPEWVRPLIDAEQVVQANLQPISPVLEAVGIKVHRLSAGDVYSNVVEF